MGQHALYRLRNASRMPKPPPAGTTAPQRARRSMRGAVRLAFPARIGLIRMDRHGHGPKPPSRPRCRAEPDRSGASTIRYPSTSGHGARFTLIASRGTEGSPAHFKGEGGRDPGSCRSRTGSFGSLPCAVVVHCRGFGGRQGNGAPQGTRSAPATRARLPGEPAPRLLAPDTGTVCLSTNACIRRVKRPMIDIMTG